jgi:hypothetical protein
MRRARRIHLARHAVPPPSRCEPATAVARVAPTIPRPYGMGLRTHDERLAEMKGPPLLRPPGQVQPTLAVDPLQSLMTPPTQAPSSRSRSHHVQQPQRLLAATSVVQAAHHRAHPVAPNRRGGDRPSPGSLLRAAGRLNGQAPSPASGA